MPTDLESYLRDMHRENELAKQRMEAHQRVLKQQRDELHADRWWSTYNAALSGIYANSVDYGSASPIETHNCAVTAANLAHGELPK